MTGSTATLAGRHALVTGGGRGIGAAIARRLLADGASVTLLGRDAGTLQATVQALHGQAPAGAVVSFVTADIVDADSVARAFATATEQAGPVAMLVNNAGQAHSAPFLKTDAALWQRMLGVNLTGTFLCTQAALPAMLDAGWGRIVNVASTAGLIGYGYVSAYCAAKHGVIGLTRALALETAARGVTVNAVCPGYTETDIVRDAVANIVGKTGRTEEQARAELAARNPQRRLVQPDEVADAVAWLCQPSAAAITGQAIPVAGGEVMAG
ncbi:putative short-chain dehydrogenases/reductases (SDR) family protein [Cupriavidus taiwanensis]|uniref:Short-chain dehydrogenases/reductases (SDR) family protein n=1 Tax=Cupriavidus taiwanensis TaxID=164546 RepID=A0A976AVM6_9BURK|nr:SDR family NAD(P)-dependent oxidoreductase [Cupriavidus taiwanensis]SOZ13498.1 putative short-chain dehydrogenases/reductases (SDR) family protein [Cupriavidus taiwanensis]SOZ23645.1 putative short-chain dehydrogenases/reductases (SDR) family protein [Cupriavidus taiwanensis]SOZ44105.1 putative short-chain dehydrogenases/reductases (SDR) family protein [Cupriavidus taiwanensis]SOZ52823.1 putative short-chain dehydrogenases/reductases (SDR) family protein [Cupriavidus taiwanensis]SOZ54356.1 